ncbi:MAG: hypothetical protein EXQ52_12570 [Bryobacterales bacterium]|nr:hypothetical protein [Bryobacterales bacterium]
MPLLTGFSRRLWLMPVPILAGLMLPLARDAFGVPSLDVRLDGDRLHVAATGFSFLNDKVVQRVKSGASAGFAGQLSLTTEPGGPVLKRVLERFVVSYDLWEEKFSAVRLGAARRALTRATAAGVEAFCVDGLSLDASGFSRDRPFWLKLEIRAEDPKEQGAVVGEPGINLTRLIEIFSRPARGQQPHWTVERGPLRLADLKTADRKG